MTQNFTTLTTRRQNRGNKQKGQCKEEEELYEECFAECVFVLCGGGDMNAGNGKIGAAR